VNDLEFKRTVLDPLSESFCAAKWYNATIWLGSGQTTSCHHPPAHLVDKDKVSINPRLLHNTDQKKQDRAKMIAGERPAGCEYCWKIEDMGRDAVSDRVYKSKIYPITTLKEAYETPPDQDVNLRTLEIAFDRTCQFACSYCNPAFSSTWVRDIHKNGPYQGLVSDGRNHFTHEHTSSQLYSFNETNPYVEAFFAWWETDLHKTLQELRITGGEPLMSGYTWKLIEWFKQNQGRSSTKLAINSNLGFDADKLQEFVTAIEPLPHVELYTSMEAVGTQAEYIRDGLDYAQWLANVHTLLQSRAVKALHVMCTVNALCLDSLPELLNQLMDLKQLYGRDQVNFSLNILRFPSFQSALVLPEDIRTRYRVTLEEWLYKNRTNPWLHEHEVNHTQRLIDYLDVVKTPHSDTFEIPKLLNDFRQFYSQYDGRRHKNFSAAFPKLAAWYDSIQI
jgi:organic radical activating enzyme